MKIATQVLPALQELAQRLDGLRIAMLTLREGDGQLTSRPLTPQEMDANGAIWILLSHGNTAQAIRQGQGDVSLAFSDERRAAFISITGRASLVVDTPRKQALWALMARPWFPGGPADPSLLLLRVQPQRAEVWDGPASSTVRALSFAECEASAVAGEPLGLGRHAAFGILPSLASGAR